MSSLAVLEGIAISIDPNYKVLGSTYPWIARKVLTDSSPKLKSSLQALLYEVWTESFTLQTLGQARFLPSSPLSIYGRYPYLLWQSIVLTHFSQQDGLFRIDRLESLLTEVRYHSYYLPYSLVDCLTLLLPAKKFKSIKNLSVVPQLENKRERTKQRNMILDMRNGYPKVVRPS